MGARMGKLPRGARGRTEEEAATGIYVEASASSVAHSPEEIIPTLGLCLPEESEPWRIFDLGKPFSVTIGRSPEADLVLPRAISSELRRSVSRVHARLFRHEGELLLEDLHSHNFTYLNGRIVFEATAVPLPSEIRLGGVTLRLEQGQVSRAQLRRMRDLNNDPAKPDDLMATATHNLNELDQVRNHFRWLSALLNMLEAAARARRGQELVEMLERGLKKYLNARDVRIELEVPWAGLTKALPEELSTPDLLLHKGIFPDEGRCDERCTRLHTGDGRHAAWIILAPGEDDCVALVQVNRSVTLAEGGGNEVDALLSVLFRVVHPMLGTLEEVELHRAATKHMLPHTPTVQVLQLCEEEQLWGVSAAHLKALYYAELAATRYLGAARMGGKLSVVFFLGDTGTGKSALARIIHRLSDRATQPFYELNCAAIPVTLAESELFGYEKGAHDKAFNSKPGWFELASTGTLFLDEIGKTTTDFQSKLLKVLDTGEFTRLGSNMTRRTHCNIILATSEDPAKLCAEGTLLHEFWYRVGAFTITLAPLGKRTEDVAHLVQRKLEQLNRLHAAETPKTLSTAAHALVKAYHWPGNVRELMQYLEVAYALSPADCGMIDVEHLPESFMRGMGIQPQAQSGLPRLVEEGQSWDDHVAAVERQYLVAMLAACAGNLSEVARRSGKPYQTIHNKLNRLRQWVREAQEPAARMEADELRTLAGECWKVVEK